MKIAICEFHQETNSFVPFASTRKDYEVFGIQKGQQMIDEVDDGCALKGILDVLGESKADIIPTYRMWANAAGPVEDAVVTEFLEYTLSVLEKNLPLDGVCISFHGATQSGLSDDVCGDIAQRIREVAGQDAVLAATFDLHANITKKISDHIDVVCGYHTYPHVDFYQVGRRAASLCLQKIKSERKLYQKHVTIPMIAPASGYTTCSGVFHDLMSWAESLVENGQLEDFSIFQMQPWLDVADGQSSIITYSEDESCELGMEIAKKLVDLRGEFSPKVHAVEDIIREAEKYDDGRPVVLVDSADSPNAGACGDSAYVLREICRMDSNVKAAIALCCKPTVDLAFERGVGQVGIFTIGGSLSFETSKQVMVSGMVMSLHAGTYKQEGPAKRGLEHNLGRTAVIRVRNTTVILTSDFLLGPGDMQLFRHFGVEPTFYQLIDVKACTSFRAGYEQITDRIYDADTPGAAASVLTRFQYKKLPKSFYPFKEISYNDIKYVE